MVAFNSSKIKPLLNSFYEYLYSRACEAFDCGIEQQNENRNSEEQEIVIPLFNSVGSIYLKDCSANLGSQEGSNKQKKEK